MKNNKAQVAVIVMVLILVVALAVGFYIYSGRMSSSTSKANMQQGRMVFAITDAAKDLNGVTNIYLTVNSVQAHSTTEGWVTVSSAEKTYDLIALRNSGELDLAADANVSVGMYDQVRLEVTKVEVVDANGTHEAKLPSNELKIDTDLNISNNSTATAKFDFIADESLHMTGNGEYILAPVVQVETRENADVSETSDGKVRVDNGRVKLNDKFGMDENGTVGVGVGLGNKDLSIDDNGKIKINMSVGVNTGLGVNNGKGSGMGGVSSGIGY